MKLDKSELNVYSKKEMSKYLAIVSIISFIAIAVLGFIAINHNGKLHVLGCIASLKEEAFCPEENVLAFINFHLNVLRSFSIAVFNILPALALFFVLSFLSLNLKEKIQNLANYLYFKKRQTNLSFIRLIFMDWLSFHENSPNRTAVRTA